MSKHFNRRIVSGISDITGLPVDILSTSPIFQLYSDREMIIEGARNLEYYDDKCAKIDTGKIRIIICGDAISIKCLANSNLSVNGYITDIKLEQN